MGFDYFNHWGDNCRMGKKQMKTEEERIYNISSVAMRLKEIQRTLTFLHLDFKNTAEEMKEIEADVFECVHLLEKIKEDN